MGIGGNHLFQLTWYIAAIYQFLVTSASDKIETAGNGEHAVSSLYWKHLNSRLSGREDNSVPLLCLVNTWIVHLT